MLNSLFISSLRQLAQLIHTFFWLGLWLFGTSIWAGYLIRWWTGDHLLATRVLSYFMPWLLIGLIPALVSAGLARRYGLMMILGAPTIFISLTFAPLFLPRSNHALAAQTPLKVMSYNVWGLNKRLEAAAELIQQEQPDILLLQEAYRPIVAGLHPKLNNLYPDDELYLAHEPRLGQAVISRYPLRQIEATRRGGRIQKVVVDTPDGPITVWNVHPHAPLRWVRQYDQISTLAQNIAVTDGPLIVGGDFNTTDQSETYSMINQYLSNAHWDAGWGFGFTFPSHTTSVKGIPVMMSLVRIDHIFYSDHFFVHKARTLATSGGSDHLPVIAELSLVK